MSEKHEKMLLQKQWKEMEKGKERRENDNNLKLIKNFSGKEKSKVMMENKEQWE